ncbi:MAG: ribonuclease PH [Clostridiales bacterium]|nr:ribonuclease PH [Clostridiales bacterium]
MRENRKNDELRKVKITNNYLLHPDGSVLIEMGNTKVICTAMVEDKIPRFLKGTESGWVTAEYSMIPGSTETRKFRNSTNGKIDGRGTEIQRLIGRSLRSVVNLKKLNEKTIWIDCDVIQADGGTRTASITGAYIAMVEAMKKMKEKGQIDEIPVENYIAAISVGKVDNEIYLDLEYSEDSKAIVDMNVVMTEEGKFVEIQGTGEESPFSLEELNTMLEYSKIGIEYLIEKQKEIIER